VASRKDKKRQMAKENLLSWVLHEWDCLTVEEAMEKAKEDSELHRLLRECGMQFPKD